MSSTRQAPLLRVHQLRLHPCRLVWILAVASLMLLDSESAGPLGSHRALAQDARVVSLAPSDSVISGVGNDISIDVKVDAVTGILGFAFGLKYSANVLSVANGMVARSPAAVAANCLFSGNSATDGKICASLSCATPLTGDNVSVIQVRFRADAVGAASVQFDPSGCSDPLLPAGCLLEGAGAEIACVPKDGTILVMPPSTLTPTTTRTFTVTRTAIPSSTATASRTYTRTATATPTPTATRTASTTLTFTATRTPTTTPTATPTASPTRTSTTTASATPTLTATESQTVTSTASPTASFSATPSATPSTTTTTTPTPTASTTPTVTVTPTTTSTRTALPSATPARSPTARLICIGDCNGNGGVAIEELLDAVAIALDESPITTCAAADANGDGEIVVEELVRAVTRAAFGCP